MLKIKNSYVEITIEIRVMNLLFTKDKEKGTKKVENLRSHGYLSHKRDLFLPTMLSKI